MKQIRYIKIVWIVLISILLIGCGSSTKGNNSSKKAIAPIEPEPRDNFPSEAEPTQPRVEDNSTDEVVVSPTINTPSVNKAFQGKWKNLDTGGFEKIDDNYSYSISSLGDNFIKVTKENNKEFMLLRYGSANGTVKGQLYSDISSIQKSSQKMVRKKIDHREFRVTIDDGVTIQTTDVQSDGRFNFLGVHSGDSVRITIHRKIGGFEDDILPDEDGDDEQNREEEVIIVDGNFSIPNINTDVGTFIVPAEESSQEIDEEPNAEPDEESKKQSYNLKLIQTDIEDQDDRYMYSEGSYSGEFTYKNFGKTEAIGLNYTLSTDDAYVDSLELEVKTGTLLPDESISLPFRISFKMLDKVKHTVKLTFLVRDANGKDIMLDYVYLNIYQSSIWVNIKAKTSNIKGYFVTPEHEVINIDSSNMRVRLPKRPNEKYYFVVTQPTDIEEETIYSIGVGIDAPKFGTFNKTGIYEPNNDESSATKLKVNDGIKSFIDKEDVDFYTIDFKLNNSFINPPNLPFE